MRYIGSKIIYTCMTEIGQVDRCVCVEVIKYYSPVLYCRRALWSPEVREAGSVSPAG